jgi:PAS domain S-box-containing protein
MVVMWGADLVLFFNSGYIPVLGEKQHWAMGKPMREVWPEIWDTIGPMLHGVLETGNATYNDDLLLPLFRNGYLEECYFTFSYSPISDESGIGGVFCAVNETSGRVIGERRLQTLHGLESRALEAKTVEAASAFAAETLAENGIDLPYTRIYLVDRGDVRLSAWTGARVEEHEIWANARVLETGEAAVVDSNVGVAQFAVVPTMPAGVPREALLLPLVSGASKRPFGLVVAGLSPHNALEGDYRSFLHLVAAQIGSAISSVRAYEEERARAQALAELDRAKTTFFSNVSHEFRTPLTLMLGPLIDLAQVADPTSRPLIDVAHRNALRLLKLVNNLLEFSRLEAGRSDPAFEPTDLAQLTTDLCSAFRSAIERAGLEYDVDVRLDKSAMVDRGMWEKIVLNLLSNALKFTLHGSIRVTLEEVEGFAQLSVADSGSGIPTEELDHIFERFRRVRGTEARSHEGSGIGLALTRELVELHGGTIDVVSAIGKGTTFRVRIPHSKDASGTTSVEARPVHTSQTLQEYLADADAATRNAHADAEGIAPPRSTATRARVLVVDDNADLRDYLTGILRPHYELRTVKNGIEALQALESDAYDVVISDVMMPGIDGFQLLEKVRDNDALAATRFILLSARAGDESAVEGLTRGADDYIAKPFSAEQFLARVQAQVQQTNRQARAMTSALKRWFEFPGENAPSETVFRVFADQLPIMVYQHDRTGAISYGNSTWFETLHMPRDSSAYSVEAWERVIHPDDLSRTLAIVGSAIAARTNYELDYRLKQSDAVGADADYRWHKARAVPQFQRDGTFHGWIGSIVDIHDTVHRDEVERALRDAQKKGERDFRALADTIPTIVWTADATGWIDWYNSRWYEFTGQTPEEAAGWGWQAVHHPDDFPRVMEEWPTSIATGKPFEMEFRLRRADGEFHYMLTRAIPVADEKGNIVRWYGSNVDIQPQRDAMERTRRVAETLQGVFLPEKLPHSERVRMDAIYQPAQKDALVGGDWFHATHLPDGAYLLSIGDVAGHGMEASIIAGRLRYAISDFALNLRSPADVLECVNRILRFEYPETFATALVAFIDPACSRLEYATAGHQPPILARADGSTPLLPLGGMPIGVDDSLDLETHRITIGENDVLVLYTDGLTEFARDWEAAEKNLRTAAVRVVGDTTLARPAAFVRDMVLGSAQTHDDAALLVAQFSEITDKTMSFDPTMLMKTWRFHSSDPYTARTSRMELATFLRRFALHPDDVFTAELILGEILANTVEHAPGLVEMQIDWTSEKPVLIARDTGPGLDGLRANLPEGVFDEGGRGLFLIKSLAESVAVSRLPGYGTELRVVLPLERR